MNGAAAHLVAAGDIAIIANFVLLGDAEARSWEQHVVFVDCANRVVEKRSERPALGSLSRGLSPSVDPGYFAHSQTSAFTRS